MTAHRRVSLTDWFQVWTNWQKQRQATMPFCADHTEKSVWFEVDVETHALS